MPSRRHGLQLHERNRTSSSRLRHRIPAAASPRNHLHCQTCAAPFPTLGASQSPQGRATHSTLRRLAHCTTPAAGSEADRPPRPCELLLASQPSPESTYHKLVCLPFLHPWSKTLHRSFVAPALQSFLLPNGLPLSLSCQQFSSGRPYSHAEAARPPPGFIYHFGNSNLKVTLATD